MYTTCGMTPPFWKYIKPLPQPWESFLSVYLHLTSQYLKIAKKSHFEIFSFLASKIVLICLYWFFCKNETFWVFFKHCDIFEDLNDKSVQAIGMGQNGIATEKRRLKVANLTVYSTEKCRKLYGSNRDFVKEMMICAFSPEADTCKGDSGGSIFYKEPNTKSWIILGITSKIMGKSCDGQNIKKHPKSLEYIFCIYKIASKIFGAKIQIFLLL